MRDVNDALGEQGVLALSQHYLTAPKTTVQNEARPALQGQEQTSTMQTVSLSTTLWTRGRRRVSRDDNHTVFNHSQPNCGHRAAAGCMLNRMRGRNEGGRQLREYLVDMECCTSSLS